MKSFKENINVALFIWITAFLLFTFEVASKMQ